MKKRHSRNTNSAESGEIVGQALISQKCKRSSNVVENNGHCWVLSNILDVLIASATYANGVWVAIPEISKTGDLYHYKDDKSRSTVSVSDMQLNFVAHANGL